MPVFNPQDLALVSDGKYVADFHAFKLLLLTILKVSLTSKENLANKYLRVPASDSEYGEYVNATYRLLNTAASLNEPDEINKALGEVFTVYSNDIITGLEITEDNMISVRNFLFSESLGVRTEDNIKLEGDILSCVQNYFVLINLDAQAEYTQIIRYLTNIVHYEPSPENEAWEKYQIKMLDTLFVNDGLQVITTKIIELFPKMSYASEDDITANVRVPYLNLYDLIEITSYLVKILLKLPVSPGDATILSILKMQCMCVEYIAYSENDLEEEVQRQLISGILTNIKKINAKYRSSIALFDTLKKSLFSGMAEELHIAQFLRSIEKTEVDPAFTTFDFIFKVFEIESNATKFAREFTYTCTKLSANQSHFSFKEHKPRLEKLFPLGVQDKRFYIVLVSTIDKHLLDRITKYDNSISNGTTLENLIDTFNFFHTKFPYNSSSITDTNIIISILARKLADSSNHLSSKVVLTLLKMLLQVAVKSFSATLSSELLNLIIFLITNKKLNETINRLISLTDIPNSNPTLLDNAQWNVTSETLIKLASMFTADNWEHSLATMKDISLFFQDLGINPNEIFVAPNINWTNLIARIENKPVATLYKSPSTLWNRSTYIRIWISAKYRGWLGITYDMPTESMLIEKLSPEISSLLLEITASAPIPQKSVNLTAKHKKIILDGIRDAINCQVVDEKELHQTLTTIHRTIVHKVLTELDETKKLPSKEKTRNHPPKSTTDKDIDVSEISMVRSTVQKPLEEVIADTLQTITKYQAWLEYSDELTELHYLSDIYCIHQIVQSLKKLYSLHAGLSSVLSLTPDDRDFLEEIINACLLAKDITKIKLIKTELLKITIAANSKVSITDNHPLISPLPANNANMVFLRKRLSITVKPTALNREQTDDLKKTFSEKWRQLITNFENQYINIDDAPLEVIFSSIAGNTIKTFQFITVCEKFIFNNKLAQHEDYESLSDALNHLNHLLEKAFQDSDQKPVGFDKALKNVTDKLNNFMKKIERDFKAQLSPPPARASHALN